MPNSLIFGFKNFASWVELITDGLMALGTLNDN